MKYLPGLENIIADYDVFVLDIWGTLHNGQQIFPGVLPTLRAIQSAGKRAALLSNSPSRLASVTDRLAREFGITSNLYQAAHNSGESSYLGLRDRADAWHARLGKNYYFIHAPMHTRNYADLPYRAVPLEDADFIVITKTLNANETLRDYESPLRDAAHRGLPMLCCNPDRVVNNGDHLSICPGTVAAFYESIGGDVFYHGKPYEAVYHHLNAQLGAPDSGRILAIGDAFETDIRGGNRMGWDTMLLMDGIHRAEIHPDHRVTDLTRLAELHDAVPTYAMDQLRL